MSRIVAKFASSKQSKTKVLIPYITAGDPAPEITVPLMHELVKAGADIIELGVPFSDPMADGPVIEAAHHRALEHHVSLNHVLAMVEEFRHIDQNTPVVLMGYLNPFAKMGYSLFADQAKNAGVDAVLVVDLPPEEAHEWLHEMRLRQIDTIFLLAPTTKTDRIKLICDQASGYLYYVSLKGVTGAQTLDVTSVVNQLSLIRKFTSLPIAVGFGIRDAKSAAAIGKIADAVIVGSALVSRIAEVKDQPQSIYQVTSSIIREMRLALDMIKS